MRLGKIAIGIGYVVDLDNEEMVNHAKQSLYEDMTNSVKYREIYDWISIMKDGDFKEEDIPQFLLDGEE